MNGIARRLRNHIREREKARHERIIAWQEEYYRKRIENPGGIDRKNRPRLPRKWLIIGIAVFWTAALACFLMAYGIMQLIYRTWFPDAGHGLLRDLLTVVLMLNLCGGIMAVIRLAVGPRELDAFFAMISAMRRLAKGDFNVALDTDPRKHGQLGVLFRSFNEMANELSQMEKMRQEFISNVSHEFQSPLTAIGGFARALQTEDLSSEKARHYLDIIETETARLSKLSDNLLKLTSLESNHHPFEPRRYRLDRQLRMVVLSCEPHWRGKNLEMDISMEETAITADEDLLSQVWINLLHNAVKFTPEGGTVRIDLEKGNGRIAVTVSDNGIGVSEEDLPHLFERFFKADKSRGRTGSGSGLGLSIVKKIVEMHGGDISVCSKPGVGTSFTVSLPETAKPQQETGSETTKSI